eukprot:4530650-Amphidinium_carterae.1
MEAYLEDAAEKRAIDSRAITNKEVAKGQTEVALQKAKELMLSFAPPASLEKWQSTTVDELISQEGQTAKTKELMAVEQYMSNLHGECD